MSEKREPEIRHLRKINNDQIQLDLLLNIFNLDKTLHPSVTVLIFEQRAIYFKLKSNTSNINHKSEPDIYHYVISLQSMDNMSYLV